MKKILIALCFGLLPMVEFATDVTWDFTGFTSNTTLTNGVSYSYTADDGKTEMRYTAGSSDAEYYKKGDSWLKENGKTGDGNFKDVDGTTVISKNRLIRLFVSGTGTVTINCTSNNIGKYKVFQSNAAGTASSGDAVQTDLSGNGTASNSITVSGGCIWIETTTRGYITSIVWSPACTSAPTISVAPSSATYDQDEDADALSFTGTGHTAQKWQYSSDNSVWNDFSPAETGTTYTPSTSSTGTTYYRVVTTCDSYSTYTTNSTAATITVNAGGGGGCTAPALSAPASATVYGGQEKSATKALAVTVSNSGAMTSLSYQWYSDTNADATGGTALTTSGEIAKGSQGATYSSTTSSEFSTSLYYYCVVTNTCGVGDVASTTSYPFTVTTKDCVSPGLSISKP